MTLPPTLAMMLNAGLLVGCSAAVTLWNAPLASDLVANPTGGGSVQLEPAPAGSQPRKTRAIFVCRNHAPVTFSDRPCGPAGEERSLKVHEPQPGRVASTVPAAAPATTLPRVQPEPKEPPPDTGERAAAACATSARSSTTACGQATRRAKPRNSGTAGAVSTPRSTGRAADTGPALDSRVSEEKRMNSNTLLHVGVVLFACTAALAGCSRKADETPTATQPTAPAATTTRQPVPEPVAAPVEDVPEGVLLVYVWDCDDGTSLTMKNLLRENAIVLDLHEGPRHLPQVVSASGAKYDDGSVSFWTKGDTAMFERKGNAVVNCRDNRARSLVADARARGITYRGQGNEPGWISR